MSEQYGPGEVEEGQQGSMEQETQRAQETAREYADEAKQRAGEYGEQARQQVETGKEQAAGGMHRAAEMIRERSAGAGGVSQAGTMMADRMETAAEYLRSHDTSQIWNDLESYARTHPTQAIAGAVVTGVLIGRILR